MLYEVITVLERPLECRHGFLKLARDRQLVAAVEVVVVLDRHVTGTVPERHAVYDADDPAAVAAFRDAGSYNFV